ncbi:hypothetical protein [Enterococcus sp. AZ101]|uniref:hypothetical protein n=1 Tax=Enterococcus sp. AZ101 TaxID=2774742 RepID=UPI003D2BD828
MKRIRYGLLFICIVGLFLIIGGKHVSAESYIEDQTGKINQETKEYVSNLNQEKFSVLDGKPEYGVVITHDVEPQGNSLELHLGNKFRNFDFQTRNAPVNSLLIFVLAQDEVYFAHGEKLTSIFEPLNEDEKLKHQLLELIKADNYNEAVIEASDRVYADVKKAYAEKGLAKITQDSDKIRADKKKQKEFANMKRIIIVAAVVFLIGMAYIIYLRYKNNGVKRQFYLHKILPNRLVKDALFNQKDFDHWLKSSRNVYNRYSNKNEALRALKYYCMYYFFPKKINQLGTISDQRKNILKRMITNQEIGDNLFANYFENEQFTFLMFNLMITDAQKVSDAYAENLLSRLSQFVSEYDIDDEVLESKCSLIPKYKLSLYEEAKEVIVKKQEQADYLVENMIANKSYEQLLNGLPEELEKVTSSCLKVAIFNVDLEQVYELKPIYKEIIENDFSDEDLAETIFSIRIGYATNRTSILKLQEVVKSVIINMQDTIKDRNKRQTTVVRFDFGERDVKTTFRPKSKNRFFD